MIVCDTCGRQYFHRSLEGYVPYPEYNQDRAILAEVLRMNRDPQCTLYEVLPAACVKHLERLANNGEPGPRGCDEEVTA